MHAVLAHAHIANNWLGIWLCVRACNRLQQSSQPCTMSSCTVTLQVIRSPAGMQCTQHDCVAVSVWQCPVGMSEVYKQTITNMLQLLSSHIVYQSLRLQSVSYVNKLLDQEHVASIPRTLLAYRHLRMRCDCLTAVLGRIAWFDSDGSLHHSIAQRCSQRHTL